MATLPAGLGFVEALRRAREGGKGAYPVVEPDGRMIGVCTRSDLYRAVQELRPTTTPLTELMSSPVVTIREDDSIDRALQLFLQHPVKRLVVVDSSDTSRPVGMLTPFDLFERISQSDVLPHG